MSDAENIEIPLQPAADAGSKLPVEKWAEKKGLWPQFGPALTYALPGAAVQVDMRAVTGPRANPEFWKFAAARAHEGWPEGKELTEAEFDAAIEIATGHVAR